MYKDKEIDFKRNNSNGEYNLNYELTKEQKKASEFLLENVKNKKNCILNAVTGAGKTEIIYPLIKYCVDERLNIAIAIPRKDVVIELYNRISGDFKCAKTICVYGGHNEEIFADIVILTTHQLYRYKKHFDVIVLDEVDAFPFYNNNVLMHFLKRSSKGAVIYMSATIPFELLKKDYPIFYLNKRYHGNKLDVPKVKYFWNLNTIKKYIKRHSDSIIIVYFPTIKLQNKISKKIKINHYVINSKTVNRKEILAHLHNLKSGVIFSTLVLERGVTFKNTNVIVYWGDHCLFKFENLVQISGRVGRNKLYPHGDIIFLVKYKNKNIRKAIKFIKKCNE